MRWNESIEPPAPKPYEFIDLTSQRSQRNRPRSHARLETGCLSGVISGTIVAKSPVHVASGSLEMAGPGGTLIKAVAKSQGFPIIPGTSLKGAIRSIVETISSPASCIRVTTARADAIPQNSRSCRDADRLCLACNMFGALGYQGRICFSDATKTSADTEQASVLPFFAPRTRERLYYEGGFVRGRKFYRHGTVEGETTTILTAKGNVPHEVCPQDSEFRFQIHLDDLAEPEIGLLLAAMGLGNQPYLVKLGGGKPACFGSVEFRIEQAQFRTQSVMAFDVEYDNRTWTELARLGSYVDSVKLRSIANVLQYPGSIPCPDHNY